MTKYQYDCWCFCCNWYDHCKRCCTILILPQAEISVSQALPCSPGHSMQHRQQQKRPQQHRLPKRPVDTIRSPHQKLQRWRFRCVGTKVLTGILLGALLHHQTADAQTIKCGSCAAAGACPIKDWPICGWGACCSDYGCCRARQCSAGCHLTCICILIVFLIGSYAIATIPDAIQLACIVTILI